MNARSEPTAEPVNAAELMPDSRKSRITVVGPAIVGALLLLVIGIFKSLGISLKFQGLTFVGLYLAIGAQSVAYSVFLIAIQFPRELFLPAVKKLARRPEVLVTALALGFLFFKAFPVDFAFPLLVTALLVFVVSLRTARRIVLPGMYLFVGLLTAFCYSVVGVTVRFEPNFDSVLQRIDYVLLLGHSVSQLSHQFAAVVPPWITSGLLLWYALMFPLIGATLMLCSTMVGHTYAMKFVSTILLAYLFSVIVFLVFPTHSPYFSCPDHWSSRLPGWMLDFQKNYVETALARFHGIRSPLGPEYYISFPCMHIAQPLIAMWYLRRWKRIALFLIPVNLVLMIAIVLLEWHYFVDLLGGVLVAAVSTWLIGRLTSRDMTAVARLKTT